MKTPEEMAEEYADANECLPSREWGSAYGGFLAGYNAAQQWISVKERLPKINEWVLIDGPAICKRINPPSSNWKGSYAWETDHDSFYSPHDVTHWMPLPGAPKEEEA